MPLVFRSMLVEGTKPTIGSDDNQLGVRVHPHPRADIPVDDGDTVSPLTGGMSVNPSLEELIKRPFLVPRRLRNRFPGARAVDSLVIWRLGNGPFDRTAVAAGLMLAPDEKKLPCEHGVIEPDNRMSLQEYQESLAATRNSWECAE